MLKRTKNFFKTTILGGVIIILPTIILVGLFVRTRLGQMIYHSFERSLLSKAPGYRMVKETVNQFLRKKKSPFSSVALVQPKITA